MKLQIFGGSTAKGLMSLPSGIRRREAWIKKLEVGPLHNNLEKGLSEPSSAGYDEKNTY
jgi:hypothetical protein